MLFRKIDSSSANTVSSALGFFETPPSNVGIASSIYREILTLNPLSDTPYTFRLHPGSNFLDLSHMYLETEMQIQKKDGNNWIPIEDGDHVSTIQAIGATWIRNMKVTINGRETFNSNQLYAYKSYIDLELSYNREVKSSYLGICGYHPSGAKRYNVDSIDDEGYTARKRLFEKGKKAQFYTKLNADLFTSDLFMINNVSIEIEIHPHTSEFLLLDYSPAPAAVPPATTATPKPTYRLAILGLKLFTKYVELMDGLSMDIAQRLENSPARYGIRRSELKSAVITGGVNEFHTTLFTEQIPRRIIVVLVEPDAYNGSLTKSPFVFKPHQVRDISVISGGITWPAVLYNMKWENLTDVKNPIYDNAYMRCYNDLMEGIGLANSIETNGITPEHFRNGWCFYCFTLTSDLENSPAFELVKAGTTSLMIRFNGNSPAKGLNAIIYGELDTLLMVDKHRQITSDRTV